MRELSAGTGLVVEAWNQAGGELLATGRLLTLDNQIDPSTGTIKAKATFDNADDKLFPNQFVNARLKLKTLKNTLVIPTSAVQRGSDGFFVYRVQDSKAQLRPVVTGHAGPQHTVVTSGLEQGDIVVIDGVDRLRDGTAVSFNEK
jgi:multidrug efflux system membrane fusion protein